ncbi:MAG: methyltetrahydrofolate cobalamin methyltransferase [Oscillospiraceae bacterium]|nr:methyltetrahydrofolate cobalamin methyltransferase [Oscillospiraceae bacterium]
MIIIGEKINGSIPSVAKAIAERNGDWIRNLAKIQTEAGATFLDVCASVKDNEVETLHWLIDLVQEVTDTPICVDSPDPHSCVAGMQFCKRPGLVNSVSMEGGKVDTIFPVIAGTDWQCVALLCAKGIPSSSEERLEIFDQLMEKAAQYKIAPSRLHIDPLVEMLCTSEDGISTVIAVIKTIREKYPDIHITGAVSNISFNLPVRKLLNQAFLALTMSAGMDSGVMDPTNRDLMGMMYATEAMLGLDDYCMEYISAYRQGIFGPVK